ncbi:Oidioi.mRNA.OKI2018_I69.chr2.g5811.t1.cds [Oikopleura dioica]|uniref:Beta-1,4-glucuronyltransferase 1 n=1 Tax=Oikopleura dioica TaxID=34765 RepID=A0ABN7T4N9_OIKDI|nr:Oidioi.mRNA.OKI2018_I69.chr2.g5811.t1.cds [Oikopleura dioica]
MISTLSAFLALVIFLEIAFLTRRSHEKQRKVKFANEDSNLGRLFAGETYDYSGEYRIIRFYKTDDRNFGESWEWNDLTLVTQSTLKTLAHLPQLLESFTGPVSYSIFCPGLDASFASAIIDKLTDCNSEIRNRVTFHFVYPAEEPADLSAETELRDSMPCENIFEALKMYPVVQWNIPWNILRNVGQSGAHSEFALQIDSDVVPSKDLRADFIEFIETHDLWDSDDVREVYLLSQKEKDANAFERSFLLDDELDESSLTSFGTEKQVPYFIARRNIPLYDERFKSSKFDRKQLFCELHTAGYKFKTITSHFLSKTNEKQDELNEERNVDEIEWLLFNYHFKDELQQKYGTNKTCPWISTNESALSKSHNKDFLRYRIQQNEMGEPVATSNEPPLLLADSGTNVVLPKHDHRRMNHKLKFENVKKYSAEELKELYEKGLSAEVMKEFRVPKEDDLTWELD